MNNLTKIVTPLLLLGLAGSLENCATSEGNVVLGEFLMTSEDPADRALGQALVTYGTMSHEKEVAVAGRDDIRIYIDSNGNEFYGSAIHATGTIHKVWTDHQVIDNGERGMYIHTSFTVKGNQGFPIRVVAYFADEKDRDLVDRDGNYTTFDGHVFTGSDRITVPTMDYSNTVTIFIPYDQLDLVGKGYKEIKFHTRLLDFSEGDVKDLDISGTGSFGYIL